MKQPIKALSKPTKDVFTQTTYQLIGLLFEKEYEFHPTRKWRFDYCNHEYKIAIEVEGGAWTQGRHTRGKGFINDMDKYNTCTVMGWRLLRVTPDMLLTTKTIDLIKQLIDCKSIHLE